MARDFRKLTKLLHFEVERADRKEIEAELSELKQNFAPTATFL